MEFALFHGKLLFAVLIKHNVMGFGFRTFQMFVSALFTQWSVTIIAVELAFLRTVLSTTI